MRDIEFRKKISLYEVLESFGEYGESVEEIKEYKKVYADIVPLSNAKIFSTYGKHLKNPRRVIIREKIDTKDNLYINIDDIKFMIMEHNNYGGVSTMIISQL